MTDLEFNQDGCPLLPDTVAEIQRRITEALAVPNIMLEPSHGPLTEWLMEVSEHYLESMKNQKSIEDFSVNVGTPYVVYKFRITKKGYVIEHRRDTITGALSEHRADYWALKGRQGPHKSRRLLRRLARHTLGEYAPVDMFFTPVKPAEYITLNLTIDKDGATYE
jgi:hypothetical protein